MKQAGWFAAGTVSLILSASAAISTNPYQDIVVGNAFRLRPILLEPMVVPPPPPPPAIHVQVTGVTDAIGRKVALVEISRPGKTPLKPVMAEGDTVDTVELLHIDVRRTLVKMRIQGVETNLTLAVVKPGGGPPISPPAPTFVRR